MTIAARLSNAVNDNPVKKKTFVNIKLDFSPIYTYITESAGAI